jgi:hypothetical protein
LSVAADAERPGRALVEVLDLDFLSGQIRLAKAVGEQFFRDVAVLLTTFTSSLSA